MRPGDVFDVNDNPVGNISGGKFTPYMNDLPGDFKVWDASNNYLGIVRGTRLESVHGGASFETPTIPGAGCAELVAYVIAGFFAVIIFIGIMAWVGFIFMPILGTAIFIADRKGGIPVGFRKYLKLVYAIMLLSVGFWLFATNYGLNKSSKMDPYCANIGIAVSTQGNRTFVTVTNYNSLDISLRLSSYPGILGVLADGFNQRQFELQTRVGALQSNTFEISYRPMSLQVVWANTRLDESHCLNGARWP